jgi:hypothetical protein
MDISEQVCEEKCFHHRPFIPLNRLNLKLPLFRYFGLSYPRQTQEYADMD